VPTYVDPAVSNPNVPPTEFRRYRRFVSWFVFTFVLLGTAYMLVSVAVTISRRYQAVPLGSPVGMQATRADVESCYDELSDVVEGLQKYLDNSSTLMAHYDAAEAQRWASDRDFWLGQWKASGARCQYTAPRHGPHAKEWEQLAIIHTDLRDTEASYTKELIRFGQAEAPRLDLLRERLESVGRRIATSAMGAATSRDSGDTKP